MSKALEILEEIYNKDIWQLQKIGLEHIQIYEAIAELVEQLKPKTCKMCQYSKITINSVICGKNGTYKEEDDYCKYFNQKDIECGS